MIADRLLLLVIEDNPGDARLVKEALSGSTGFDLEYVDRLDAGISRLGGGGVDVVLLDLGLPDSQGIDGLTALLKDAAVAVVVLTGSRDEALGRSAVSAGAQDFLVKGEFWPDSLARTLRYAVERHRLLAELKIASSLDELTGVHRRGAGLVELEREMARATRTKQPFVLAFVDVDGLKVTNDSLGHAAGDQLLCRVVNALRANLRSYDLIVRFGGDEFVCALTGLSIAEVAKRFVLIDTDLSAAHKGAQQASVTVGFAELKQDDSLEDLIARADEALYKERRRRPSTRA